MSAWMSCPSYVVDLDRPLDERFDAIDPEMIDRAKAILAAVQAETPPAAIRLAPLFNARTRWRFSREVKAMGRYAGIDWRWLMLANVSYDLLMACMSCSTVALPSPDGPLLARNMDWWPEDKLAAASCITRYVRGGRLLFAIAGWPGSLGVVTGISARGFAVALNAVLSRKARSAAGYPVLLLLRTVLEDAAGFDEAVAILRRRRLFTGALLTVVGTENRQRVCIERTPTRAELRWGEPDAPLVTTNHYRRLDDPGRGKLEDEAAQFFETTCGRYERLLQLSERLLSAGEVDTEGLLRALTDEAVIQEITAQHAIMQPARGAMELYVPRRLVEA
jgi:hypothetical protein